MNKKKTIFVIEDSKIIAEIIRLELQRKFDCKVLIFKNGEDVISGVKKNCPDLIVLDYNFEGNKLYYKNGLALLIDLRKEYKVPVIVFSGQRSKEKAIELIREGANDYISKDDNDFIVMLLKSIQDIFEIKNMKNDMMQLKNRLRNNMFLVMFFLLIAITAVFKITNF